jgi:hypothetical protein
MRIVIEAKPEKDMRYAGTLGDWFINARGDLIIQVVGIDPFSHDQAFLVALHELIEAKLCQKRGITVDQVDEFDLAFKDEGEPGDQWNSPYRKEHRFAMLIEHLMAHELGIVGYGAVE